MAMKLFKEDVSGDSERLEDTLIAIDRVVFGEDLEESLGSLKELDNDQDLLSECLSWRKRFSMPDAEATRNKWQVS